MAGSIPFMPRSIVCMPRHRPGQVTKPMFVLANAPMLGNT